jgi:hypothetical protein
MDLFKKPSHPHLVPIWKYCMLASAGGRDWLP